MSDKRSVATDALETLGTIIDANQKRDAIHLAVLPVQAGDRIWPGREVTIRDGLAYEEEGAGGAMGIADPFLSDTILAGQWFWYIVKPRTINSLRHVWSHPAFPDEPGVEAVPDDERKAASKQWLLDFVGRADCPGFDALMDAVQGKFSPDEDGYGGGYIDGEYLHFNGSDAHGEIPREFWDHAEIYLGKKLSHRPEYFSCSC